MKKLALGLLLTAGISGNAWASEGKADVKIIKKTNVINCTIYTTVTTYDSEGNQVGQPSTYCSQGSGADCDGAVNGEVRYQQSVRISGKQVKTLN